MALGRRAAQRQDQLWVATDKIITGPGSPFYTRLNLILADADFDRFTEASCAKFYAGETGRPGIPPGVYFRMLMVGYLEGLDSERGIAWRCADSLSLREFLGYELTKATPDHSTLSVIRGRIDLETHQEVFVWILGRLADHKLLKGKTIGIDATTLQANAALRSLVRHDSGEAYREFLESLAKASGIETPTREDLAKLDRKRKKKGSNDDWLNPHDPDAKITKMKDGRTHLAHKAEHAVDLETGATVAVTIQPANRGDTTSIGETLCEVMENLDALSDDEHRYKMEESVKDKGYHSNGVMIDLAEMEVRSYVSEPDRGRRNWKGKQEERDAVYANRRRIRSDRGKRLLRKRGELVERSFAHCYETGGMRRTYLRGHENILKRLLIHVGASNLGLLMRTLIGSGTPRGLHDRMKGAQTSIREALDRLTASIKQCTLKMNPRYANLDHIPNPRPIRLAA
ncbi:MAG: transposase [Planctomycetes bacterium]|nr:transposase [Planctomycetota bacterium]